MKNTPQPTVVNTDSSSNQSCTCRQEIDISQPFLPFEVYVHCMVFPSIKSWWLVGLLNGCWQIWFVVETTWLDISLGTICCAKYSLPSVWPYIRCMSAYSLLCSQSSQSQMKQTNCYLWLHCNGASLHGLQYMLLPCMHCANLVALQIVSDHTKAFSNQVTSVFPFLWSHKLNMHFHDFHRLNMIYDPCCITSFVHLDVH